MQNKVLGVNLYKLIANLTYSSDDQSGHGTCIIGFCDIPYTRVNKRNSLLSAYCLLSAGFFPGFAP